MQKESPTKKHWRETQQEYENDQYKMVHIASLKPITSYFSEATPSNEKVRVLVSLTLTQY